MGFCLLHILKYSNNVVEFIKPQGMGIGLEYGELFENSLEEIEIPISPKEIYIFTSDGVNEAMNDRNEFFGYEEISKLLQEKSNQSSKEIVNSTIQTIETFRGTEEPNDDITMVVLKIL